jgi:hypothetical protein
MCSNLNPNYSYSQPGTTHFGGTDPSSSPLGIHEQTRLRTIRQFVFASPRYLHRGEITNPILQNATPSNLYNMGNRNLMFNVFFAVKTPDREQMHESGYHTSPYFLKLKQQLDSSLCQ